MKTEKVWNEFWECRKCEEIFSSATYAEYCPKCQSNPFAAEIERLKAVNAGFVEAAKILISSLDWEEKRSGTTYHGCENLRAAILAKVKGG